jgi:superfamily II DNA or RNA helicase
MINKKRVEIQTAASDAIVTNKFKGIIEVSPRVGKCKITIDALNTVKKSINVLVVAPRVDIFKDWKKEVIKWKLNSHITIEYVWSNSLKKNKNTYHLIVADEIHAYNVKVLGQLKLHQNKGSRILGLTGTLDSISEFHITNTLQIVPIYTYTIDQAIKDKIISDYKIYCVGCELDNVDKHIIAGTEEKPFMQTEKQAYGYWDSRYKKAVSQRKYSSLQFLMGKRKEIIYNSKSKLTIAQELSDTVDRCLIFTGSQKVADQLGEGSYHSKSDKKNLSKFKDKVINKLSVISMISMGITIDDLKVSIFNQLKSGENLAVQQAMRAMNEDEGKMAIIYIIYLKDTQDEVWLKSALNGFNRTKVKYCTIENLKN